MVSRSDTDAEVAAWIADEVDPAAAAELQALLDAGDDAELADRFSGPLTFGTAGLRGPLRAGPNGMNRAVVRRAAAGLAAWLAAARASPAGRSSSASTPGTARPTSRATRPRSSPRPGFEARLLPRLAADAGARRSRCSDLGAAAGVMVTASHNPPQDNGYKVYAARRRADRPAGRPRDRGGDPGRRPDPRIPLRPDGVHRARTSDRRRTTSRAVAGLGRAPARATCASCTPRCTASAPRSCAAVFAAAGFAAVDRRCRSRSSPTPTSRPSPSRIPRSRARSTSRWPWPRERGADIVIANDPDADRCAVAVPDRDGRVADAARRRGRRAARRRPAAHGACAAPTRRRSCRRRCSARWPRAHGVGYAETLTGFKWIAAGRPRSGVRLRGGARLRGRAGPRARQGRHQRGAAAWPSWPPALKAGGLVAARPAGRAGRRVRALRHRSAVGAGRGPGGHRRRPWRRLRAAPPATLLGAAGDGRGPAARRRRRCGWRWAGRPGGRAAVGHRTEAQGLPGGGRGRTASRERPAGWPGCAPRCRPWSAEGGAAGSAGPNVGSPPAPGAVGAGGAEQSGSLSLELL